MTPAGTGAAPPPALLARRLAAIAYDALLLFSVLFFATLPAVVVAGGEAIVPGNPVYLAYLLVVAFLYFAWPWTHGGQTLGMKSWRIRACAGGGGPVTWRAAALRFASALVSWLPAGLGFWIAALDPAGRTLHDRLSGTRLVRTAG